MMTRRVGRLNVVGSVLVEALGLPKDTVLVSAEYDFETASVDLYLASESFEPVAEGERVPQVQARIVRTLHECRHKTDRFDGFQVVR